MKIVRTVATDRPMAEVFAYLSDFTSTEEWDPGTLRTTRESGDGGVGTRYRNVSRFLGSGTELTYRADFAFKGAVRLMAPLMAPALRRLGNEAQAGLKSALASLGS